MAKPRLHLDADASLRALHKALLNLFTFNIRDFTALSLRYPQHAGIILAAQQSMSLAEFIDDLDRLLSQTDAADWVGQVRWLADWRR